jgi:hypothetical protein
VQRLRVLEAAEGRDCSTVLIQANKPASAAAATNPAESDGANSPTSFVSSLKDHLILAVNPFSYYRLLKYLASPRYVEIRSRVRQFVGARSGPLMNNFDQKNFISIMQKYPASQTMLVVKTMLYNIGGVGERRHCLINLLGYVKYSWDLESIKDFLDYMHLPVNALLELGKNKLELTLQRFFLKKNRIGDLHFSEFYDSVPSPYPGENEFDPSLIFLLPEDKDETGGQGVVPSQPLPSSNGDAANVVAADVEVEPNLEASREPPPVPGPAEIGEAEVEVEPNLEASRDLSPVPQFDNSTPPLAKSVSARKDRSGRLSRSRESSNNSSTESESSSSSDSSTDSIESRRSETPERKRSKGGESRHRPPAAAATRDRSRDRQRSPREDRRDAPSRERGRDSRVRRDSRDRKGRRDRPSDYRVKK